MGNMMNFIKIPRCHLNLSLIRHISL